MLSTSPPASVQALPVPGGEVAVGTRRPILPQDGEGLRRARIRPFLLARTPVTNATFARFAAATGYRTEAERQGWSFVFALHLPGDHPPTRAVVEAPWWRRVEGASWRSPEGGGSSIDQRLDHPAVHLSWDDARACAGWLGGRLPSEAEWEHAARGGLPEARYPWGDREPEEDGFHPCNIWQGRFPDLDTGADGWRGTSPVAAYAANGLGFHDLAGNVWEWCADPFRSRSLRRAGRAIDDAATAGQARVLKGGSHLCHRSYCWRYRIAARIGNPPDTTTGHIGMRVAFDPPADGRAHLSHGAA